MWLICFRLHLRANTTCEKQMVCILHYQLLLCLYTSECVLCLIIILYDIYWLCLHCIIYYYSTLNAERVCSTLQYLLRLGSLRNSSLYDAVDAVNHCYVYTFGDWSQSRKLRRIDWCIRNIIILQAESKTRGRGRQHREIDWEMHIYESAVITIYNWQRALNANWLPLCNLPAFRSDI